MTDTHERCWLCVHYVEGRCTNTFSLKIHVEPHPDKGIGGMVDFSCTPGMVPEELKPELTEFFQKYFDRILPAISMLPIWDKIREWQLSHPDKKHCPGNKPSEIKKNHLKVVKAELPTMEPDPLSNKDSHGLFKSDVSIW